MLFASAYEMSFSAVNSRQFWQLKNKGLDNLYSKPKSQIIFI